jgi:hypothetical protein
MSNIKIEHNRKTPSDQDILKKKDFDSVLKGHKASLSPKKWFQSMKLWSGVIATACVAGIIGFYLNTNEHDENEQVSDKETILSEEQFNDELNQTYLDNQESFLVDPSKDTLLITGNGSVINIPSYAFDTECKSVKLVINEIDDPVKMFQSKIDMAYDSAGTKYQFESAGMIELKAFAENESVELKDGKEISIALVTSSTDPTYNLYHKTDNNWDFKGTANEIFIPKKIVEDSKIIESVDYENNFSDVSKSKINIGKSNPSYPTFDVDVSANSNLNSYRGLVFQVDQSEKEFLEDYYMVSWEKIELNEKENQYYILLSRGGKTYIFKVNPVLNSKDYAHYLKNNKKKNSSFNELKNKREKHLKEYKDHNMAFSYNSMNKSYQVSSLINKEMTFPVSGKARRVFSTKNLGVINCDHVLPKDLKKMVALSEFKYKAGKEDVIVDLTYVIIPGINTLFTFKGNGTKYYAKKGKTKVWIVDNGQIGILKETDKKEFAIQSLHSPKEGIGKIAEYCQN